MLILLLLADGDFNCIFNLYYVLSKDWLKSKDSTKAYREAEIGPPLPPGYKLQVTANT